ncbi:MAG: hypothetical protein IH991_07840 [Planctomycetes bacterium]|nr:hypothetical protein [Planctomycetota bacterium]
MRRRGPILVALLLCFWSFPAPVSSDIISPGTYRGYYFVDRWGQKVLNRGTSYTLVSERVASEFEKYARKPIEVNVTKILQPMNPGAGMIVEANSIKVHENPLMSLIVKIRAKGTRVTEGHGLRLTVSIKNQSEHDITVWPGAVQVILVTNRPFSNKAIGYPGDLAYWCHQHSYHGLSDGQRLKVACRAERTPWSGGYIARKGTKLRTTREPLKYVGSSVVFASGGEFQHELVIGKQLLAREYEVFIHVDSRFPSPMSNRIAFDVVPEGEDRTPTKGSGRRQR